MKITTWNMQGGANQTYLGSLIAQNSPDVICLQESGDMTSIVNQNSIVPIENFPGSFTAMYGNGNHMYMVVFWYNNVDANPRNSLAVMSRITVTATNILSPVANRSGYNPDNPRCLPSMTVNEGGRLITIYSYHAPSVGTANACNYNNAQIAAIAIAGGVWAVVGDFNADPTDRSAFVALPSGMVVRGNHATQQSGGLLDYSITNAGAGYTFSPAGNLLGASDHYPQNFNY